MAKFKIPKCKIPRPSNPIKRRDNGKLEVFGLTGFEWLTTTAALIALYLILAAFFAALLTIATTIRDKGDTYQRPGSEFPPVKNE